MSNNIRIGSRGSALALWQANFIKSTIEQANPGIEVEIIRIKTKGDKILDVPLAKVGGKGLFVKEIEDALLEDRIDMAIHSMKDVPTDLPAPLILEAITRREDPRDALISRDYQKLDDLPKGARIGTSSLRRQSQLLHYRPDLTICQLRGNIDTRIQKALSGEYDAVILAAAGVRRMGWEEKIREYFDDSLCLPAIGQGALGIEIRRDDAKIEPLVKPLNHPETSVAVRAERSFLKTLEGGCQVPIAAFGRVEDETISLTGLVADTEGKRVIRETGSDHIDRAEILGKSVGEHLLSLGARDILAEVYGELSGEQ